MNPEQALSILTELQALTEQIRTLANSCIAEQQRARFEHGQYLPIQETPSYEAWRHARRAQDAMRQLHRV